MSRELRTWLNTFIMQMNHVDKGLAELDSLYDLIPEIVRAAAMDDQTPAQELALVTQNLMTSWRLMNQRHDEQE